MALSLGDGGLALDSLELLTVSSALVQALHTHRSGVEDRLLGQRRLSDWIDTARFGLARFCDEVTFLSSGSTGVPRPHTHQLSDLAREVAALIDIIGPIARVIAVVPSHHIYGFIFTQLLPSRSGVPVVRLYGDAVSASSLQPGDLVVGYPEFWRAFGRSMPRLAGGIVGVTATAPCPAEIADAALSSGLSRLIEIYGASETAGIGWREAPADRFALFWHWRRGVDGLTLMCRNDGEPGRIVTIPDRLIWHDRDAFTIGARTDGAVQVGGINVFPALVRQKLIAHPLVADAAVRLMRPDEGTRLKAFVVLHDAAVSCGQEALLDWLNRQLAPVEHVKSVTFGSSLPTGALGKPADWIIASL